MSQKESVEERIALDAEDILGVGRRLSTCGTCFTLVPESVRYQKKTREMLGISVRFSQSIHIANKGRRNSLC